MRSIALVGVLAVLAVALASGGEPGFRTRPSLRRAGKDVRVTFTASAPTHVEVAVLDAAGEVIRHLAAGMLGEGPPPPLKKGMAQEVSWDGKDDFGRAAPAGCSVRVRLGLRPRFAKILFHEPGISFSPRAVSVGPDKLLYVLMEHGQTKSTFLLQAYTKEGKYVRTVMPYPADLDAGRLAGLPRVKLAGGRTLPMIQVASVYGADGKLKHKKIIDGMIKGEGSPVVDLAGNIYIASAAKPSGQQHPAVFGEKAPNGFYDWMYGSVIKFSPKGGKLYYPPPRYKKKPEGLVWPPPKPEALTLLKKFMAKKVYVDGAVWLRPEFAALPGGRLCGCYTGRFTVDRFGRAYIPDVGRFSVLMVDAANNEIARFGDYGNEDSAGPGSGRPKPEIPLSWPHAVSVGKSGVYVSDFINRRIVKVRLVPSAEASCPVK